MNRLQTELQRLYRVQDAQMPAPSDGRVRAMVLSLGQPAHWQSLAQVWLGVQADLDLPAPAIAVSGTDAFQLWFSLEQPVAAAWALAFLEALRRRYMTDVAPGRIDMAVRTGAPSEQPDLAMPPVERIPGQWSAFVAPDLAAVFGDQPWLDLPPSADAQADQLSRLQSTRPADLQRAWERIGPGDSAPLPPQAPAAPAVAGPAATYGTQPRQFLLDVMNDPAVPLHLRIEAAKALLPGSEGHGV